MEIFVIPFSRKGELVPAAADSPNRSGRTQRATYLPALIRTSRSTSQVLAISAGVNVG